MWRNNKNAVKALGIFILSCVKNDVKSNPSNHMSADHFLTCYEDFPEVDKLKHQFVYFTGFWQWQHSVSVRDNIPTFNCTE